MSNGAPTNDEHNDNQPNSSYCLSDVVNQVEKNVSDETSREETPNNYNEVPSATCQAQEILCNDSVIIVDDQNDLHLLKTFGESFPSGNQKIEGGNLCTHEYQKPCSELISNATKKEKCERICSNELVETESRSKEDRRGSGNNYQVVLVSDKDLIAEEFTGVLTENLDDQQSIDKCSDQVGESFSDATEAEPFESNCKQRVSNDADPDDISQRYLCYVCGKAYKQLSHLTRHTKSAHSNEHFHQCTICDITFTRAESLIRHLKLHEQRDGASATNGPFKCPRCAKTYQQPYNVTRHILTHTGEKPFRCPECDKTFTQHTGLSRHLIIHKGSRDFKCDKCGRAFARQFVLNRHRLTHTDDKPYKCFVCSKSFIRASQLEGHIKAHQKKDTSCHNEDAMVNLNWKKE